MLVLITASHLPNITLPEEDGQRNTARIAACRNRRLIRLSAIHAKRARVRQSAKVGSAAKTPLAAANMDDHSSAGTEESHRDQRKGQIGIEHIRGSQASCKGER